YGDWSSDVCSSDLLDTRGLMCFSNHIENVPSRWKLRVRAYGDPPAGAAFFEVKYKLKSIGLKKRATIPLFRAADVLQGRRPPTLVRAEERHNLDAFIFLQR